MRFYWLKDRVTRKQFAIHWELGKSNLADYYPTKNIIRFLIVDKSALYTYMSQTKAQRLYKGVLKY